MKILFVSSEVAPFAASGGLADVSGSLPKAIKDRQQACRVIMPLYSHIQQQYGDRLEYITNFEVDLSWRKLYCGLFKLNFGSTIHYFIDSQAYFARGRLYGEYDDGERFAFFSKAVATAIEYMDFAPEIVHCNDWQTALIPLFINLYHRNNPKYKGIKTVFTIHNMQFQGKFPMDFAFDVLGLLPHQKGLVEYDGMCNCMKAAIEQSDTITTVSPTYAKEILSPWYGFGLDHFLRAYRFKLLGIINGIDQKTYNPEADSDIPASYTERDLSGKAICKQRLQEELGLWQNDSPLVGMVTRLTEQKGLDLVAHIIDEVLSTTNISFALLGEGDPRFESFFTQLAGRYPGRVAFRTGFNPPLSHRIYAGSDLFLMPSATEPCGLAQMIALRYGSIPIVRKTGGLGDTITDVGDGGIGFTFVNFNAHELLHTIRRAVELYYNQEEFRRLISKGMSADFSWRQPASEYIRLYERLLES